MEAEIRAQIPGIDHVVSEYSAVGVYSKPDMHKAKAKLQSGIS